MAFYIYSLSLLYIKFRNCNINAFHVCLFVRVLNCKNQYLAFKIDIQIMRNRSRVMARWLPSSNLGEATIGNGYPISRRNISLVVSLFNYLDPVTTETFQRGRPAERRLRSNNNAGYSVTSCTWNRREFKCSAGRGSSACASHEWISCWRKFNYTLPCHPLMNIHILITDDYNVIERCLYER